MTLFSNGDPAEDELSWGMADDNRVKQNGRSHCMPILIVSRFAFTSLRATTSSPKA